MGELLERVEQTAEVAVGDGVSVGEEARVAIVQHAEKERLPGDPGLSARGCEQARRIGARLVGRRVVALYASPQRRAYETAAAIRAPVALDVVVDDRLRERLNWDGPDEASFPAFVAEWERTVADRQYVPSGGDSSASAGARLRRFLDDADAGCPPGLIVAVSHGGVTVDLLRDLLGDVGLRAAAPDVLEAGVPSCGLTALAVGPRGWQILGIGEAP